MKNIIILFAILISSMANAQQIQSYQVENANGLIEVNPSFENLSCLENEGAHRVSVHMLNGEVSRRTLTTQYLSQPEEYNIIGESHYDELAAILSRGDGTYAPTGELIPNTPSGRIGVIVPAEAGRNFIIAHGYIYGQPNNNDRIVLSDGSVLYWVRTTDVGDHITYTSSPGSIRFSVSYCGVYTRR